MNELISRKTQINDSYPTCEFVYAKLQIYTGSFDPKYVSNLLDITPSRTITKGEKNINSLGRVRTANLNAWFLSSEGQVSSKGLRRHLDWLLDKIALVSVQLTELQQEPGITMRINCTWWSAHGEGGPTLWPEQMKQMADLNLECALDITFYGPDDED